MNVLHFLLFVFAPNTVGWLYQLHCTCRLFLGRLTALLTAKTPVNPRVYKRLRWCWCRSKTNFSHPDILSPLC